MSLNISSEKLDNPLLIELLRQLSRTFSKIGSDFFVIGATARDIILNVLANTSAMRKTHDLDIAIAVSGWDRYNEICQGLIDDGLEKSDFQTQRFFFGDYEVDIVPYGTVAKEDGNIYWPPDESRAMSVKSFEEVLSDPITVSIDNEFEVKIVTLHGLFLLKLNAWLDRHSGTNKDAEDIWHILDNYYLANESRGIHPEVYELDGFDLTIGGAYWMAQDIADLLTHEQIAYYSEILKNEIDIKEDSRLVIQILETYRYTTAKEVLKALQTILDVFTQRCNGEG